MSDGFEAAQGQRNFLERLGDKVPGYRGFQNRELRRDVDRMLREHLASEVGRLKGLVQGKIRDYTDAGRLAALNGFQRLDRQLDGLGQTIRFSDYGASGLFDPVKIGEPELERVYQFDLSIVEDLATIEQAVAAVPSAGAAAASTAVGGVSGAGAAAAAPAAAISLDSALDRLRELVQLLDDKWRQRRQVIASVVGAGPGA